MKYSVFIIQFTKSFRPFKKYFFIKSIWRCKYLRMKNKIQKSVLYCSYDEAKIYANTWSLISENLVIPIKNSRLPLPPVQTPIKFPILIWMLFTLQLIVSGLANHTSISTTDYETLVGLTSFVWGEVKGEYNLSTFIISKIAHVIGSIWLCDPNH